MIWACGVIVHEIWGLIKRFGTSASVYSSTNKRKSSGALTSQGYKHGSSFQPEGLWQSKANNTWGEGGERHVTRWNTGRREKVYQRNLMTCIFYDATGQEIFTVGVQPPCSPLRGCLKVNSDTMLPGQQMLMDEDKRLRVRAQLLLPEDTVHICPGLEEPVWETDMGSLDQSDLFWSHFFLNLNRKIVTLESGLLQAEFILWLLLRRIKVIVNVHTNHILEVAFHPTSLQRWVCNTQLFSLILNSAQLWKNLYFDLVNISAHVLGQASKVCEQISKLPPGSFIVGNLNICSISRVKRTYSTEKKKKKKQTIEQRCLSEGVCFVLRGWEYQTLQMQWRHKIYSTSMQVMYALINHFAVDKILFNLRILYFQWL